MWGCGCLPRQPGKSSWSSLSRSRLRAPGKDLVKKENTDFRATIGDRPGASARKTTGGGGFFSTTPRSPRQPPSLHAPFVTSKTDNCGQPPKQYSAVPSTPIHGRSTDRVGLASQVLRVTAWSVDGRWWLVVLAMHERALCHLGKGILDGVVVQAGQTVLGGGGGGPSRLRVKPLRRGITSPRPRSGTVAAAVVGRLAAERKPQSPPGGAGTAPAGHRRCRRRRRRRRRRSRCRRRRCCRRSMWWRCCSGVLLWSGPPGPKQMERAGSV